MSDLAGRMTVDPGSTSLSQCAYCRRRIRKGDGETCEAFPGGIPDVILRNEFDHREPWPGPGRPGDRGLRFRPHADVPPAVLDRLAADLRR